MHSVNPIVVVVVILVSCACPFAYADKLTDNDKMLVDLVKTLAQDPHLMDARYLSDRFGAPEVKSDPGPTQRTTWQWHDRASYSLLCQLEKDDDSAASLSDSKLTVFAQDGSNLSIDDLESAFGKEIGKHFDQRLYKTTSFAVSERTKIIAFEAPNNFRVKEVQVEYAGAPLPSLSPEEINDSIDARRARGFEEHKNKNYDQSLPLLSRHLQVRPADAEARIKLAETLKARCCLNQAIEQYRLALKQAGNDSHLRQQCLDGLRSLKVLPATEDSKENPGQAAAASQPVRSDFRNPVPAPRSFAGSAGPLDPGF